MAKGSMRSRRGSVRSAVLAGPLLTMVCVPALAGPQGEVVRQGQASFNRDGSVTTITASHNSIIEYKSFNVAGHETVRFVQPSEQSRVLNRVNSADPSRIDGSLIANGRVYLVNPAGVYFGDGALVNVGALYAAAGNISNNDFNAGRDHFKLTGRVENRGFIQGDMVALLGTSVANFGTIVADEGTIAMVAGDEVLIGTRNGRIFAKASVHNAGQMAGVGGVENAGMLHAENGDILLGAGDIYAMVIHDASKIRAEMVRIHGGMNADVMVSGSIDVSNDAIGAIGGSVEIFGNRVGLIGADIDASGHAGGGTILVGGDYRGQGDKPTAMRTAVDYDSTLRADAMVRGDGGTVIVWADELTGFAGHVSARGGAKGGDGGFAEVSGKEYLIFRGTADMTAAKGELGTLLLDPRNITIIDAPSGGSRDGEFTAGVINADPGVDHTLSKGFLEAFSGANLELIAEDSIFIESLTGNVLDLSDITTSVIFRANDNGQGAGNPNGGVFQMQDIATTIVTAGADISIFAHEIILGGLTTGGGDVLLDAGGAITLGDGTITNSVNTGGGSFTATAGGAFDMLANYSINAGAGAASVTSDASITLAGTVASGALDLTADDNITLNANVTAGGQIEFFADASDDGTGTLAIADNVTVDSDDNDILVRAANLTIGSGGRLGAAGNTGDVYLAHNGGGMGIGAVAGTPPFLINLNTYNRISGAGLIVGGTTLGATRASSIEIGSTLASGGITGDISFDANSVSFTGGGTVATPGSLTIDAPTAISFGADLEIDGNLFVNDGATASGTRSFTTEGYQVWADTLSLGGNTTFTAHSDGGANDGITFASNVSGAGTLLFRQRDEDTDFQLGNGTTLTNNILLDNASIGNLVDGFASITFGYNTGAAELEIGTAAFDDAVLFRGAVTTVTGALSTTDSAATIGLNSNLVRLEAGSSVTTAGAGITFVGSAEVFGGGNATVTSGGGNIAFNQSISGDTSTPGAESLTLNAGSGSLTVSGSITGDGTGADPEGLTAVTITNAGATSIQSVDISGALMTSNRLTGGFTTNGQDIAVGSLSMQGQALTFAGIEATSGGVSIDNTGQLNLNGDVEADGAFAQTNSTASGLSAVSFGGDITADGISFVSDVTSDGTGDRTLSFGTGGLSIGSGLDVNGRNLDLVGNGALSIGIEIIDGAGTDAAVVTMRNNTTSGFISVGATVTGPGVLEIPSSAIDRIDSSIARIDIGTVTTGAHEIFVGNFSAGHAFRTDARFLSPNGLVSVRGEVRSDADLTFLTPRTELGGLELTTQGGSVVFDGDVVVDTNFSGDSFVRTNGGGISVAGDLGGDFQNGDRDLELNAGSGTITLNDVFGDLSLGTAGPDALRNLELIGGIINIGEVHLSGGLTVDNAATLTLGGEIVLGGAFAQTNSTSSGASAVSLNNDIEADDGISFVSDVTAGGTGGRTLAFGTGGLSIGSGLDVNGRDLDLVGNGTISIGIEILDGAGSGSAVVSIRPNDVLDSINIGSLAGGAALTMDSATVNRIDSSIARLDIGTETTGQHTITVGGFSAGHAFRTDTRFIAPTGFGVGVFGGEVRADADLTVLSQRAELRGVEMVTQGGDVVIDGDLVVDTSFAQDSFIRTNGGAITVNGDLGGEFELSERALELNAGSGTITLNDVFGDLVLGTPALDSLRDLELIGGAINVGNVALLGDLTVDNAGVFTLNGDVELGGEFAQTNSTFGLLSANTLGGSIDADGGISFSSATALAGGNRTLRSSAGAITFGGLFFDTLAFDAALIANSIDFSGLTLNVTGTGNLILRPVGLSDAIDIGDVAGAGGTPGGGLAIDNASLEKISAGFNSVQFGYDSTQFDTPADGQHTIQIGDVGPASAFVNETVFLARDGGQIDIIGEVLGDADGSLAFRAPTIRFGDGAVIDTVDGDVLFFGNAELLGDASVFSSSGGVSFAGTVDGAFSLLVDTLGNVLFDDLIGAVTALAEFDVVGRNVLLSGIGTLSDAGVTGLTSVLAIDVLTFDGGLYNAGEQFYGAGDEARMVDADTRFFSNGESIFFTEVNNNTADGNGIIVLVDGADLTIRTGGGDLFIESGITSVSGASGNAMIDFDAEAGAIDILGAVGDPFAVGSVLMNAAELLLSGVISTGTQDYNADSIELSGLFETGAGGIEFDGDVLLVGDTIVRTPGTGSGDSIRVTGAIDGGFALELDAGDADAAIDPQNIQPTAGNVELLGAVGAEIPLVSLAISGWDIFLDGIGAFDVDFNPLEGVLGSTTVRAGNNIEFGGPLYAAGVNTGAVTRYESARAFVAASEDEQGAMLLSTDTEFYAFGTDLVFVGSLQGQTGDETLLVDAGAGSASFGMVGGDVADPTGLTLSDIVISANEIELNDEVAGSSIVLQQGTAGRDMFIGVSNPGLGVVLTSDEISRLRNGFDSITIGREDHTAGIFIGDATFVDPVTFRATEQGANVTVLGTLTGNDNATITVLGAMATTNLQGDIVTAGNDVLIDDNVIVSGDASITTNGGLIRIMGSIDGAGDPADTLRLDALDTDDIAMSGNVLLEGVVGADTALGSLIVRALNTTLTGFGDLDNAGVSGLTDIAAVNNIFFNGDVFHAGDGSGGVTTYRAGGRARVNISGTRVLSSGGSISFGEYVNGGASPDGGIVLVDGASLRIESGGGDITIGRGVQSQDDPANPANLTVDAGAGSASLLGGIGTDFQVGRVQVTASEATLGSVQSNNTQTYTVGQTTLNGDLRTFTAGSGAISFSGGVVVGEDVSLQTPGQSGDSISIAGDLTGDQARTVSFNTGNLADFSIAGSVGSASSPFGVLRIENARDATFGGSVHVDQFVQAAGQRLTTFSGPVTTIGDGGFSFSGTNLTASQLVSAEGDGNVLANGANFTFNGGLNAGSGGIELNAQNVTLDGPLTTTGGGDVNITNSATLRFREGANADLTGSFTQSGAGEVLLENSSFTAAPGGSLSFGGVVTLANNLLMTADAMVFASRVLSDDDGARSLTLELNGTALFEDLLGPAGARLDNLTVRRRTPSGVANVEFGAGVNTVGDQLYRGGTVRTVSGAGSGVSMVSGGFIEMRNFETTVDTSVETAARFRVNNDLTIGDSTSIDAGTNFRVNNIFIANAPALLSSGLDMFLPGSNRFSADAAFEVERDLSIGGGGVTGPALRVNPSATADFRVGRRAEVNGNTVVGGTLVMVSGSDMTFRGIINGLPNARGNLHLLVDSMFPLLRNNGSTMNAAQMAQAASTIPLLSIERSIGGVNPLGSVTLNEKRFEISGSSLVEAFGGPIGGSDVVYGSRVTDTSDPFAFAPTSTILLGGPVSRAELSQNGLGGELTVQDFVIAAEDFRVGFFENVNVAGNLIFNNISGTTRAAFGDIGVLGRAIIDVDEIFFRTRPARPVLEGQVSEGVSEAQSRGLFQIRINNRPDLVVAGIASDNFADGLVQTTYIDGPVAAFGATPEVRTFRFANTNQAGDVTGTGTLGNNGYAVALPEGADSIDDSGSFTSDFGANISLLLQENPLVRATFSIESVDTGDRLALDLNAQGISTVSPALATATALAAAQDLAEVPEDTTVGLVQVEQLRQIGIFTRAADPDTVIDAIIGYALYNDGPSTGDEPRLEVTRNRLDFGIVERVLRQYRELYREERVDPETGEVTSVDRSAQIRQALDSSVIDYYTETGAEEFDAAEFLAFVRETPGHGESAAHIRGIAELLETIRLLGLSPLEYANARSTLLNYVRPQGLTADEFEAVVQLAASDARQG
ncbi:MAG: filamentous hemagglutinin N-terminal domain-containing protein [Phycisphaerales bacterium]|nr:filamentous hemagglutinin N-terminal domain-containing protein [Phycisphaerales bacterium]